MHAEAESRTGVKEQNPISGTNSLTELAYLQMDDEIRE